MDALPPREMVLESIREDIRSTVDAINVVIFYVNRIVSLLVLIIVLQSILYLKRYTQTDPNNKENLYITKLFEKVDKERKKNGNFCA